MFNKKFIHEIFLKHTPLYSKKVLRAMFDRLAHASIMRLNAGSMDKVGLMVDASETNLKNCGLESCQGQRFSLFFF